MVDRVYKRQIPALRTALQDLKKQFSGVDSKTNWNALRLDPLLKHASSLERLLRSREHSREISRLTRGVVCFKADLDYLRTNLKGLSSILEAERRSRRALAGRSIHRAKTHRR